MDIGHDKLRRWEMLTNSHFSIVPEMTPFREIEAIEHLFWIDAVCEGQQLGNQAKKACYKRFKRFAEDQWENRN